MKRISLFLLFALNIFLSVSAVCTPADATLPKLKFDDESLQELADLADREYRESYATYTFEAEPKKWRGKSWQLMMLNYFLSVNSVLNSQTENEGAQKIFSQAQAEQVQTAMFSNYLRSCKVAEPKDLVQRMNLVEKQVTALSEELTYMDEGSQFEMNTHASVNKILNRYLVLRMGREIKEKLGESETLPFLDDEDTSFMDLYENLEESYSNYLTIVDGGGMYFSMMPLIVSGFCSVVLDFRLQSLKRTATLLGIANFGIGTTKKNDIVAAGKDPFVAAESYRAVLRDTDIDNGELVSMAKDRLEGMVNAYKDFLQMREELSHYIPQEKIAIYNADTKAYGALVAEACSSESEE